MDKTTASKNNVIVPSAAESERAKDFKPKEGHRLELDHHRALSMTGVRDVPVFTDKNVTVILDGETLYITGQDLSVKNLDVENGKLSVLGTVHTLKYSSQGSTSFVKRIFK